jgi:hypothetical protein
MAQRIGGILEIFMAVRAEGHSAPQGPAEGGLTRTATLSRALTTVATQLFIRVIHATYKAHSLSRYSRLGQAVQG